MNGELAFDGQVENGRGECSVVEAHLSEVTDGCGRESSRCVVERNDGSRFWIPADFGPCNDVIDQTQEQAEHRDRKALIGLYDSHQILPGRRWRHEAFGPGNHNR
jgi:hypothetical protein